MSAVLFSLFLIFVSACAHGMVASWAMRVFASLARRRCVVLAIAIAATFITPASRYASILLHDAITPRILAFGMIELMIVLLGAVPLALLRGVILLLPQRLDTTAEVVATISRRDAIERIGGVAVLGTTSAVLGWGMVRGRHAFELEEIVVKIPGLPRVLDGYTIAQISDLHVGLFVGERELEEGLSRLREVRADLIVATGDLVDYDPSFIPLMAATLARLRARDGVVAILGNHDYYTGARAVLRGLEAVGVKTLVNQTLHLRPDDGGGFALLGVDDLKGAKAGGPGPSLTRALAAAPPDRARILLAHQPNFFHEAEGQVALQLSGHTHGGQVNPGFSPAGLLMEFVAGRFERNGSTLYVNRGFGIAGPPTRVGAPPEVTKIVLVSA
jgi:predicted MPP superfamily phosphohydrolase